MTEPRLMRLIIAGNYQQAWDYKRKHGYTSRDDRSVISERDLRGIRPSADLQVVVLYVGTWYDRHDIEDLNWALKASGLA